MLNKIIAIWVRFKGNEEGVTLVEYGVAITVTLVVGTAALLALGGAVDGQIAAATAVFGP